MNVACPTCGADVEFRYDDSFVRVCGSCRAAVARSDRGIETLGAFADLVPIVSPLKLFADGKYREIAFQLIGMAQLQHAGGGLWQEWYAKLDGGAWAWLSEAQGRYYLTHERTGVALPRFEELRPGAGLAIGEQWFTVNELGTATYTSATGEIPYRLTPGASFRFVDLSDQQGGFATIDYGDGSDEPALYVGQQVSLADLALSGGEDLRGVAARQGNKVACPNCGGSLELAAPDRTLRVGCPYCDHVVSVETGNLAVIGALAAKPIPLIPLGSKGTFVDGELTVIGFLQRSALVDHRWYPFDEYLLYAPEIGFRWLVSSEGHWSYVQPVAPGAVEPGPVRYDGVTFERFQTADLRVDLVLGELYWKVEVGERVVATDYIAPPAMLSLEETDQEQTWSLSTYLTPREVEAAFGKLPLPLRPPTGVGANQPYPLHGVNKLFGVLFALLCVIGFARCATASDQRVFATSLALPAGTKAPPTVPEDPEAEVAGHVQFSEPFKLASGKNIEITVDAMLFNQWAYVMIDLVNETTGDVVSFDANLEAYSGIEDGESWSEGSRVDTQTLAPMSEGSYVLRVEAQHGGQTPLPVDIVVKQDVVRARWWLLAFGLLLLPFGLVMWHMRSFHVQRWENSQLFRSSDPSAPSAGDGDGDDEDDDEEEHA